MAYSSRRSHLVHVGVIWAALTASCGGASDVATEVVEASSSTAAMPAASVGPDPAIVPEEPIGQAPLCSSTALPTDGVVVPFPEWTPGMTRQLELRGGRSDTRVEPVVDGMSVAAVSLRVDDIAEDGEFVFEWDAGATASDFWNGQEEDWVTDLIARAPKQRFEYSLDADRYWLGLRNHDEVRQSYLTTVELFADVAPLDAPIVDQMRNFYTTMSDETLEIYAAEGPQLLHFFEGLVLSAAEPIRYEDSLPNAMGGAPLPALTSIDLIDPADADGCVLLEMRTILDAAAAVPIIFETVDAAFGPSVDKDEVQSMAEQFEMTNEVTAQYDPGSGFFVSVEATQTISYPGASRIDKTIITDVTDR